MVIDVSRQPGQVRSALEVLGAISLHWTFVSTGSVYADQSGPLTEDRRCLNRSTATSRARAYGEGKVACEEAAPRRTTWWSGSD